MTSSNWCYMYNVIFISIAFALFVSVNGSSGDHDWHFRSCVYTECIPQCNEKPNEIPYARQLLFWNCDDECKYICMHQINKLKTTEYDMPVEKYYGHWPYVRVWNLQEPAATLFSLLNILPHLFFLFIQLPNFKRKFKLSSAVNDSAIKSSLTVSADVNIDSYKQLQRTETESMVVWLNWFPYISMNAWVMSAIYHARKVAFTTQLDLVSALLLVSYASWCALRMLLSRIVLFFHHRAAIGADAKTATDTKVSSSTTITRYINAWTVGCLFISYAAFIVQRIVAMVAFNSVSFGDHMILCIALSVVHTVLWCLWIVLGFFLPESKPELNNDNLGQDAKLKGDIMVKGTGNMKVSDADADNVNGTNSNTENSDSQQQQQHVKLVKQKPITLFSAILQKRYLCIVCQVYFAVAALSLEVYDFPPIFIHFDAHACWHAATVPLGFMWYIFWLEEI